MNATTIKKSEVSRAVITQDVHRDADVDKSYQHLRAKFVDKSTGLTKPIVVNDSEANVIQSHLRRSSERMETTQPSSSLDWDNVLSVAERGGVAELCQYIQKLEAEKRDLLDQVHFHLDQDASQKLQLTQAKSRIDKLEKELQLAMQHTATQQLSMETVIQEERARRSEAITRFESLESKWVESERSRQHAVSQLRELQVPPSDDPFYHPSYTTIRSITGMGLYGEIDPTTGSSERVERYRREIEFLRQKLVLREQQYQEQLKQSIDIALHHAQQEHANQLEKMRVLSEMQLSSWREEESIRSKKIEAMMEEDRYSIRLEMKHGLIQRRASSSGYYVPSQVECDQTMDEVLVRMQLELLRTRRFAALKAVLSIRENLMEKAKQKALGKWKSWMSESIYVQRNAVLHMNRITRQMRRRQIQHGFHAWKTHTHLLRVYSNHNQAIACWNRLLAAERLNQVIQQRQIKQIGRAWSHWRITVTGHEKGVSNVVNGVVDAALQEEITKLHDQLASSKSEAWRYKRQLLKQFL